MSGTDMYSALSTRWMDERLIDEYGQDVKIYSTTMTVDEDGYVTYEGYSDTIETKAWVMPRFASLHEEFLVIGFKVDGDYTASIKDTISVKINDVMELVDGTLMKITEIVKYYEFNHIAYKEVIMKKESPGI